MKEEKTRLQIIKDELSKDMTRAIVEAIKNGEKYETNKEGGMIIDGVYLTPKFGTEYHGLVLKIDAPEIEQLFEQSEEDLKKRAEELRAELDEIENKLNSKGYETNND